MLISKVYYQFLKIIGPLLGMLLGLVPKLASSSSERNGFGDWKAKNNSLEQDLVWFHAASVGEVLGLEPVLKKFKGRLLVE